MGNSTYEQENTGTLVFSSDQVPVMKDGQYTLSLNLGLAIEQMSITDNTWSSGFSFHISGPRFSLQPQDIISVYPPDLNTGDYAQTLPTITLSRASLPWERQTGSGNTSDSWLVLLVVDETELSENGGSVSVSTMKVSDYLPQNEIQPTDDPDSSLVVLSMSASFAASILPAQADLQHLAHVRQSMLGQAETSEKRAVIMANRLPRPNASSIAYLVSVENRYQTTSQGNYLPGSGPETFPVLASWRFTSLENGLDFSEIASNLNCDPSTLQIPYPISNDPDLTNPSGYLRMGYVPLPHTFRNGQSSVSWYHGPLSPCNRIVPFQIPSSGPDALMIYFEQIGIFDAGYSAAWQLGRQLALQDTEFSNTLYKWKRTNSMAAHQQQQASLNSHLPVVSKMDRWNQLNEVQQAYYRLNNSELSNSAFSSRIGTNLQLLVSNPAEFRKNESFGQSYYTHYRSGNTLSFNDGMKTLIDGDFSISFWFCTNNIEGNQPSNLYNGGMTLISFYTGEFSTIAAVTITPYSVNLGNGGTGVNLCDGNWHQLVLTSSDISGTTYLKLYIDNYQYGSTSFVSITPAQGEHRYYNCYVGSYAPNTYNGQFLGKIANLRIFSEVISSEDTRLIANNDTRGQDIFPFFNKLSLLHKVPFNYLVNNEQMLPAESIRFFQIDNSWINCLIDGAYSIGRVSEAQYTEDCTAFNELGLSSQPLMTGFILRSQLVSGWKDLLCDGYSVLLDDSQAPSDSDILNIVRMERLSENILLCIFEGQLQTLDLHVKRESVHCGVASLTNSGYTITLRNHYGQLISPSEPVSGSFKTLARTLNIAQLFSSMSSKLTSDCGFASATNAAFSLQMIEGVPCVRIKSQNA